MVNVSVKNIRKKFKLLWETQTGLGGRGRGRRYQQRLLSKVGLH